MQKMMLQNKNLATFCEELVELHMDVTLLDSWQAGLGILQACFLQERKKVCEPGAHSSTIPF